MVAKARDDLSEKLLREPSGRDQDVYERVIIEGHTQREAAAEFGISQGRVCQIVKRVTLWIQQTPGDDDELSPQERLRLARYVCRKQLEHAWREAMREWRRSIEPQETVRVIEKPAGRTYEKTIRPGRGNVAALARAGVLVERICCFRGFNPAKDNAAYLQGAAEKRPSQEEFRARLQAILGPMQVRQQAAERKAVKQTAEAAIKEAARADNASAPILASPPPSEDYSEFRPGKSSGDVSASTLSDCAATTCAVFEVQKRAQNLHAKKANQTSATPPETHHGPRPIRWLGVTDGNLDWSW